MKTNNLDFISIKNAAEGVGEIDIYGEIADFKYFGDEVTLTDIVDAINGLGDIKMLELHINSIGGDVYVGNAIFNIIDAYRVKNRVEVVAYNDGLMASMASGIAQVADRIVAAENSLTMVHRPLTAVSGNADDLRKAIEMLDKAEDTLIRNYKRHFKGTERELRDLLDKETWMTADEALNYGFVTEIAGDAIQIAASAKDVKIGDVVFSASNLSEGLLEKLKEKGGVTVPMDVEKETGVIEEAAELENEASAELVVGGIGIDAVVEDMKAENRELTAKVRALTAELDEVRNKAAKFDKIRQKAIDDCITNGIRAKGDAFNTDLAKKILNHLEYEDVVKLNDEFANTAKEVLNAGKRVSEQKASIEIRTTDYDTVKNI